MVCGNKTRFWVKKALFYIGLIILVGGISVGCGGQEAEIRGNSVGNIINGGIATLQGDWVYYTNADDNSTIYKIGIDGSEREQIINDTARYINVVGDWIYYSNTDDDGTIYKIGIDGSGREQIINDTAQYINIVDDCIYYSNADDGWKIYRISTDGSGREEINNSAAQFINVVGDWIYYTNHQYGGKIYRIGTDGSGLETLNIDTARFLNVVGDWIYYINLDDGGTIYKIGIDGSGREKINNDASNTINVVGDWIYYTNWDDGEAIYKIGIDGSGREKINNDASNTINLVGDWIYYLNRDDWHRLYKIGIEGSGRERMIAVDVILQKKKTDGHDTDDTVNVQITFKETKITFNYPSLLAEGIKIYMGYGNAWGDFSEDKHIIFDNYIIHTDHGSLAYIILIPIEDYSLLSDYATKEINRLKDIIVTTEGIQNNAGQDLADLSFGQLPYLSYNNEGPLICVNVEFLESRASKGLRCITQFFSGVETPIDNLNLTYLYVGITTDQKYYIAAIFPVNNSELPRHNEEYFKYRAIDVTGNGGRWEIHDYKSWMDNYEDYLDVTIQMLDAVEAEDFEPSLLILDEIIKSFQVE